MRVIIDHEFEYFQNRKYYDFVFVFQKLHQNFAQFFPVFVQKLSNVVFIVRDFVHFVETNVVVVDAAEIFVVEDFETVFQAHQKNLCVSVFEHAETFDEFDFGEKNVNIIMIFIVDFEQNFQKKIDVFVFVIQNEFLELAQQFPALDEESRLDHGS